MGDGPEPVQRHNTESTDRRGGQQGQTAALGQEVPTAQSQIITDPFGVA
ncbi:hypothetical protein [Streptomyces sp. TRM70350]|nr:hypothetical protein [Streptomyces sp. TRM70350]MBV7697455.1 hypothetical protein [Streptomyces sp. TRM70350]